MVHRNLNFEQFQKSYLFVEIANRRKKLQEAHPHSEIISLGIGDTTEPICPTIAAAFQKKVQELMTVEGYTGYPDYNGLKELRTLIAENVYRGTGITPDEIFISDGSKPDLARLQLLFPPNTRIAVQDPVYPAYVDASVIAGKAGDFLCDQQQFSRITYMPCCPENDFFPDLSQLPKTDLIYFCSPNNPTGACATQEQLEKLVKYAKEKNCIIIYDSAYSEFINDKQYPTTIYSIGGASEVAFETSSLSKSAGFTGIRLGWTVCPKKLLYTDRTSVHDDWARIMGTCFNGANSIAEYGAIACFSESGKKEINQQINYYMRNARLVRQAISKLGLKCYGGEQSPYIWVKVPFMTSWEIFQYILENAHVVVTPGAGFGHGGHHFVRISAFAHQADVEKALQRIIPALEKLVAKNT